VIAFHLAPADGGRLASLLVDGTELLASRDDNPMLWGSYPMVPFAGRIRHGRFSFDGVEIALPVNMAPHAIHGYGYDRPWDTESDGTLVVALAWPFGGWARQQFTLHDDGTALTCAIEVGNDHRSMPAQAGWHPWFVKPVALGWAPGRMYLRDSESMPNGTLVAPPPPPYDDCFTDVPQPITLTFGADGPTIELSSSCDHWVVYDQPLHATCVEPQTGPPDAFNLGYGFAVVEPGSPYRATMTIRQVT
jgi:aldose 1-epimerase